MNGIHELNGYYFTNKTTKVSTFYNFNLSTKLAYTIFILNIGLDYDLKIIASEVVTKVWLFLCGYTTALVAFKVTNIIYFYVKLYNII